jgi:hypothetical protein
MSDDWRLRIDLHESGLARALTERLAASELEHDLESSFRDRVIVSVDEADVFCYTDSREQAERAARLIGSIAEEHGWDVEIELKRWHPVSEEWEDPDVPLPDDGFELAEERKELADREHEDSRSRGYPDYEVRVECRSHRDVNALAAKLEQEGIWSVRRWRYLMIGVADEDSANALAERIRREAPAGCSVTAEGNARAVLDERPFSPFSLFGGLGG